MFFEGFNEWDRPLSTGVTIHGRSGGSGEPVVLLHGHPRAHTTWHRVAPRLVESGLTVVCPDLRGYGLSEKPDPDAAHEAYSDRAMAADIAALMSDLGHERFAVVGHDRGQGVAYRLAMDIPDRVNRLVILDGVPILEAVERADARFAAKWWHWFFFANSPHAERVILSDRDAWYGFTDDLKSSMGEENFAYVRAAIHTPGTIRAMLEDYRAGLTADVSHSREDRELGRMIACPTLVAWSTRDDMEDLYGDLRVIWQPWVSGPLQTAAIDSTHHVAEQNPEDLSRVLNWFLTADY